MTKIILNLGLDGPTHGKVNTMTRDDRAMTYLRNLPKSLQFGAFLSLKGETLIVEGDLQFRVGGQGLYQLAAECEQDCIAAWFPDLGIGSLYGPYADRWGEFDLDYFKMATDEEKYGNSTYIFREGA